jgi:hypothetical protein
MRRRTVMVSGEEKKRLRELAKEVRDLAALEVNRERVRRIKDMNGLKPVRPPVWIDEIPWHEMDLGDELRPRCESQEARAMETHFQRIIYRWKHIQADMVVEDAYYVEKSFTDSGIGLGVIEETRSSGPANPIVSHHYEDQLDTEEKVEALRIPVIEARPERDKKNLETAGDILEGILPVRLRGHGIYYAPWDQIPRFRGVENCYMDMMDRPEFLHKIIAKFTEIYRARFEQMEAQGLLDYHIQSLHCTPPYTDELPGADYDGGRVRFKDVWFRGMAQLFGSASPQVREEFDLEYMKPLMERCGLSYYGCCEPLDLFIPYLKKIPNMRKIGVTPWANVRSSAEQIGGDYVMARKPNPANAARFDRDTVVKEIEETVRLALEYKCPYEFVLKDISTVGGSPKNLIDWTAAVMEVIDRYYP